MLFQGFLAVVSLALVSAIGSVVIAASLGMQPTLLQTCVSSSDIRSSVRLISSVGSDNVEVGLDVPDVTARARSFEWVTPAYRAGTIKGFICSQGDFSPKGLRDSDFHGDVVADLLPLLPRT